MAGESDSLGRSIQRALAIAAIPVLILAAVFAAGEWKTIKRDREARAAAAAELAKADQARAEAIRAESKAERDGANAERASRLDARVERALSQLKTNHPMIQCDAALQLGRTGAVDQAPALVDLLNNASSGSLRNCAASALVDLGETETALAAYTEWARGADADLRRSAIVGFGKIGPPAAGAALPFLAEQLQSPFMDVRYIVVDSLAKLGPAAVPLLKTAAADADKDVRARAQLALRENR